MPGRLSTFGRKEAKRAPVRGPHVWHPAGYRLEAAGHRLCERLGPGGAVADRSWFNARSSVTSLTRQTCRLCYAPFVIAGALGSVVALRHGW